MPRPLMRPESSCVQPQCQKLENLLDTDRRYHAMSKKKTHQVYFWVGLGKM